MSICKGQLWDVSPMTGANSSSFRELDKAYSQFSKLSNYKSTLAKGLPLDVRIGE